MARIAVVTSSPQFTDGGHMVIARALERALREAGHESRVIVTPQNRFGRQAAAYLATWCTDVEVGGDERPIDQVISLRSPSYAVRHPVHVCWLNHRMREYYDRWDDLVAGLGRKGRLKEGARRWLTHRADTWLLTRNVRKLFAQSRTIQTRLQRWGSIESEVLHPPPPQRAYRCDEYGDYLFAVSRLTPLKRLSLLVEALAKPAAAGVRCVIAGEGAERAALQEAIDARGLSGRVRLVGRLSEPELLTHLARCRAVCFPPLDEDYGFVTVEAFASRKAVVTCRDSGGPAELVVDGRNGRVCPPEPEALAEALGQLAERADTARALGEAGYEQVSAMTWEGALSRLLLL